MKLTEEQAFKVLNKILKWADSTPLHFTELSEEDKADFVMKELINFEL